MEKAGQSDREKVSILEEEQWGTEGTLPQVGSGQEITG